MERPRRHRATLIALYVNAAVFAGILLVMLARDGQPGIGSIAFAQNQPPIAGGAGVFVMPAQFSTNTWGCYLLDVDAQTLCAFQYYPGDKQLRLVASRSYRYDRRLGNFNTFPSPLEVKDLVEKEQQAVRGQNPSPAASTPEEPKKD